MKRLLVRIAVLLVLVALAALLGVCTATAAAGDPPLNISADNMTGSHGAAGDDEVLLNGNVRITRGTTVITANHGRYLRNQGMLYLNEDVKLVDSTTTITCDGASYSEDEDVLQLSGNVIARDRESVLRAPAATYNRRTGRADLYGGVDGRDAEQHILSERAIYFRDSLLLQARGKVRGIDEKNKLELTSEALDYDRGTKVAVARQAPVLRAKDDDGRETVIRARELRLNTKTRVAEAVDSVKVERDTLQARSDYAVFDDVAERGWLYGHPRAWDDQTTVTGDTLELQTLDREVDRVLVLGNATMDYRGNRAASKGEKNRLTGRRAEVFFTEREIDSLVATGDAQNRYEGVPQPGKTTETNLAKGDTITVFFKDREIDRARVQGHSTGEYQLPVAVADTADAEEEIVRYDAKIIDYIVPKSRIVLDGSAHLTYRDLELHSRRVEFDIDAQTLVAEGNPELIDRGEKVIGHLMTYDLQSRVGNIYRAETAYEKGLYHGERIRKVNDNELDVMNGAYSTCDLDQPHYHFAARWMKIYLKDKLVAKPVVFYIRKVPLLAFPFWVFPIKPGRHSGFLLPQVELGFNNRSGQFIRNAGYYWAPNDYMDLTVAGDYYQFEPSWVMRAEGVYKQLYRIDGDFRGSYVRNDRLAREDWDFTANHSQEVTPRTRLIGRASFVSSRDYSTSNQFGRSLAQRFNRFLRSSLAVSHTADWASFSAVMDRYQDLDADQSITDPDGEGPLRGPEPGTLATLPNLTESLPSISVLFPTRILGSIGFLRGTPFEKGLGSTYFSLDSRFVSERRRNAYVAGFRTFTRDSVQDTTTVIDQQVQTRRGYAANSSISDSRNLFGWLNVRPSLLGNFAVFDFDEIGNKVVPTGTWTSSISSRASFFGTFRTRLGILDGIRHIVTPNVVFSYSPEFRHLIFVDSAGVERDRFTGFGGIGVSGFEQRRLNFGLDQRFQVKLKRGDKIQKLDNLLSWSTSGSYDFLYRQRGASARPFSTIGSSVQLSPPGSVSASLGWVTDVYSRRPVRSLGYNVNFDFSSRERTREATPALPIDRTDRTIDEDDTEYLRESWTVGFAYSYSGGYSGPEWSSTQTANLVAHWQLTAGWGLDYSASYDVTFRELGTQRFALTRDLHCWQAMFTRTFAPGGEAEYYFRLGVKDQREIYVERGTRGGSVGGID